MPDHGPWPGDLAARHHFERGARLLHPTLRGRPVGQHGWQGFRYDVDLDVPFYERRHAAVVFRPGELLPRVRVDGPTESSHRYDDGDLCMWFPGDRAGARWTFSDGLVDLLDLVVAHLFREAWWRETSEWPGPEKAHAPKPEGEVA